MSDADNPYQASEAVLVDSKVLWDVEAAGKWRRFFNWLIDRLMIYGLAFVGFFVAAYVFGDGVLAWIENIDTLTDFALTYAATFLYYTFFEGLFGFSIGKLITNTRVVDERGDRLSFDRAALRSLCRLIPFDAVSLLLSDDRVRRAWHDSLAKSYVVVRGTAAKPRVSLSAQFADGPLDPAKKPEPAAAEASLPG
ncbi:hypothetical protein CSC70_02715 [Pseudoxanthomonas kalamensis DSM 18571]|uniref:RDD family protein n=1 Tax=Pseudoxanthomonas kalamensis TaxID=289483 RepID=UPI0013912C1D|nr:RDD family protein [Pseudoxanthomonas kalamensis]KAF1712450.1 hypothetical protein CSC70_02715 [Pseudoxanthomonas kalamensis DSM 18571]